MHAGTDHMTCDPHAELRAVADNVEMRGENVIKRHRNGSREDTRSGQTTIPKKAEIFTGG